VVIKKIVLAWTNFPAI